MNICTEYPKESAEGLLLLMRRISKLVGYKNLTKSIHSSSGTIEQSECLLIRERINELCYSHAMVYARQ